MARILLIEDDLDVCHVMEHALIDGGHAVEATGRLIAGFVLLGSHPFDLVVTDVRLPDGSGIEVADRAREKGIPTLRVSVEAGPPERAVASRRTGAPSRVDPTRPLIRRRGSDPGFDTPGHPIRSSNGAIADGKGKKTMRHSLFAAALAVAFAVLTPAYAADPQTF